MCRRLDLDIHILSRCVCMFAMHAEPMYQIQCRRCWCRRSRRRCCCCWHTFRSILNVLIELCRSLSLFPSVLVLGKNTRCVARIESDSVLGTTQMWMQKSELNVRSKRKHNFPLTKWIYISYRGVVYLPFVIGCSFSFPPTVHTKTPSCVRIFWKLKTKIGKLRKSYLSKINKKLDSNALAFLGKIKSSTIKTQAKKQKKNKQIISLFSVNLRNKTFFCFFCPFAKKCRNEQKQCY